MPWIDRVNSRIDTGGSELDERIVDAGDDKVAVIAVWRGRGKGSGASTEWRYGGVWTLREGKVISIISYADSKDALEAVGLRE